MISYDASLTEEQYLEFASESQLAKAAFMTENDKVTTVSVNTKEHATISAAQLS
jgi:hypothetical protein